MKKMWFKRKRYGWIFVPATSEGWLVMIIWSAVIIAVAAALLEEPANTDSREWGLFLLIAAVALSGLIAMSVKYGPTPKWRWGWKDGDEPRQDF